MAAVVVGGVGGETKAVTMRMRKMMIHVHDCAASVSVLMKKMMLLSLLLFLVPLLRL